MILVLPHIFNNPCEGFGGLFFSFSVFLISSPTLLLLPWLWFPLSFPNSLFTLHLRGLACKLVWFGFSLGKRVSCNIGCYHFWERGRVTSFSPLVFISLINVLECLRVVPLCSYSSLSHPITSFPPFPSPP